MPPRLMHKKSRAGCRRCKTRKVKCNEERPVCGACKRHGLECIYLEPGPPAPRRRSAAATSISTTPQTQLSSPGRLSDPLTPASSTPGALHSAPGLSGSMGLPETDDGSFPSTEERRVLELRLMHRYMQSFSDIFAGIHNNTVAEVWRDLVPAMGIRHPFLLHALYAVTTLHVIVAKNHATEDAARSSAAESSVRSIPIPSLVAPGPALMEDLNMEQMTRARSLYFNLAVRGQRIAVSNLNADNADAVCMATILISNQGFLLDHDLELNENEYTPPVQWMLLAASISTVLTACRNMQLLAPESATERIVTSGRSLRLDSFSDTTDSGKFFQPLLDYQPDAEIADREAYRVAVNLIGAIRAGAHACEPASLLSRRFFSFAAIVPSTFIGYVRQQRPRALAIMACFFAMTKEIEGIWWFRGAAERHVNGLKSLTARDWSWAYEWIEDMAYEPLASKRRWTLHREDMCSPPASSTIS